MIRLKARDGEVHIVPAQYNTPEFFEGSRVSTAWLHNEDIKLIRASDLMRLEIR